MVQLATFRYCWLRSGAPLAVHGSSPTVGAEEPEEPPMPAAAATGHSQGLAAAMVVALSTDGASFGVHASTFLRLLLHCE
eukprot:SAG25_NODE_68_length_17436_cov_79.923055_16_plen_80_part_00